ncbi:MAG: Flp family type IVb pilin [Armatimonadetes bacterium]|nr:Flp family type IVb pilin [Armatimonadota bacterium]
MLKKLMGFVKEEEGVTMVEYGLILALVAIVAIAAWGFLGESIRDKVTTAGEKVAEAGD